MSDPIHQSLPEQIPPLSVNAGEIIQSVSYTAQFENLDHVREFVGQAAQSSGLNNAAVYAVQLAVDEAFSNIIDHAYDGECAEKIECTCQIFDFGLVITLRDCGKPFDPTAIPDPDLDVELENRDIGGLGLYFIRNLMDEVSFSFSLEADTGKQCNVLRMIKRR